MPALTGVTLPGALPPVTVPDFFRFNWPVAPPGLYTFFMAFAVFGSNPIQVLALAMATVTFLP